MMPSVSRHFNVRTCSQRNADLTTLQQISQQTFLESFADVNSPENMSRYLTENMSVDKLRTELSNEDSSFYFLEHDTNVIGYLKINTGSAQTENKYERSLEIERIYILRSYQGQGTGKLLLEHALELARNMKVSFVWLGVWEYNQRAIAFYHKHGFTAFDKHVFMLGDDEQIDIIMKKLLDT
jgi:ribosomal protein S18 acetylase RimI-like enzyme